MSMTLRIEIFPNDLGPTVDFYTGVLNFDLTWLTFGGFRGEVGPG